MSLMANIEEVFEIVEENRDMIYFLGAVPEAVLGAAEKELGLSFSPSYRALLSRYGYLAVGSVDFKGLSPTGNRGTGMDVVWCTLQGRKHGLPHSMVEVLDPGIGDLIYCIDTSVTNERGENPVVTWIPGLNPSSQKAEQLYESFADFALSRVRFAIED